MKPFLTCLIFLVMQTLHAQWSGEYRGTLNGDQIVLVLHQQGTSLSGTLRDSYQTYQITAEAAGNKLAGDAKEASLGLTFTLLAERRDDLIKGQLLLDYQGQLIETPFTVSKVGQNKVSTPQPPVAGSKIPFPEGATLPTALSGSWIKSESYNSGYGSDFMGANFSQTMTFYSDGSLSEDGSNATMSGSNYSGQSSGGSSGKLEGIAWYAIGNQLYLMVFDQGAWQSLHLGKWYVEGNHLLITGVNGEKLLLSR
ncbi:MAG TPA: hypothetical protein PKA00_15715 [Saprospiraceae bacterium]|nr:hypothetical protein [Saprospiraceae bacterium]HMQ84361.1 hypothetical protein [Saprospiraceae bacterium]